jgi:transcriptional regulator with XRE-family HTH domain
MNKKFKDRLILAINGESVNSFAKKCGVRESLLRKYLTGATVPGMDKVISIANTANVMIEWLSTGKGPMRYDESKKFTVSKIELINDILEDYKKELGDKFTPEKKSEVIHKLYELLIDWDDPISK